MSLLMTSDGKKVRVDMSKDIELYISPKNPPNTGTRYTSGTDLYAHKTNKGNWYYYQHKWTMWQGSEEAIVLIDEEDAQEFVLQKATSGNYQISDGVIREACEDLWGKDFFEEDA